MAYGRFRRYRRGGWRRRRGYYGRRRYRRSYARRYINGSSRSAIRIKTAVTDFTDKKSGYGDQLGTVYKIEPLSFNYTTANLTSSPLFKAYKDLYDEMKLIGMRVNISVTDVVGNSTLPSLQIYTAWDRRHGYGEQIPTATQIKAMSTMNVATALNNNVAKISRSIYASDLIEKAQWIDSDVDSSTGTVVAWQTAGKNPNFFCPAFYMVFGSPSLSQATEVGSVHFNVAVTYYVAFRCPKYGGTSSAKDLPAKDVEFIDDMGLDDDDDMHPDLGPPVTDVERTINQSRAHRAAMVDAPGPSLEPPERPARRRPVVVTPPKN